jgi:hypothetical protein
MRPRKLVPFCLIAFVVALALAGCRPGEPENDPSPTPDGRILTPTVETAVPPTKVRGSPTAMPPEAATVPPTAQAEQASPSPVPSPTTEPTLMPPPTPAATPIPAPTIAPTGGNHIVREGETLFCIGRGYGVLPSAIASANNIGLNTPLSLGQQLVIPPVQWVDPPAGPACPPQFPAPFPGSPPGDDGGGVADTRGVEIINITSPGLTSLVTAPIHVSGEAEGAFEQSLVADVVLNGEILSLGTATIVAAEMGQRGPFSLDLPFTLPATATGESAGIVRVYFTSPRDGGVVHLTSVPVFLLRSGQASLSAGGSAKEFFAILSPAPLSTVTGGSLQIAGYSESVFEAVINVIVCGEGGSGSAHFLCGTEDNIIAEGLAMVQSPDLGLPGPFSATIPYSVSAPVDARVVLYEVSAMDGSISHVSSIPLTLAP